jgi:hypothetical protein
MTVLKHIYNLLKENELLMNRRERQVRTQLMQLDASNGAQLCGHPLQEEIWAEMGGIMRRWAELCGIVCSQIVSHRAA